MDIESKINEILLLKGISVEQLIERTGLPRMTIFNARRGKNVVISTAMKIAKALEVPLEQIWPIETSEQKVESDDNVPA